MWSREIRKNLIHHGRRRESIRESLDSLQTPFLCQSLSNFTLNFIAFIICLLLAHIVPFFLLFKEEQFTYVCYSTVSVLRLGCSAGHVNELAKHAE